MWRRISVLIELSSVRDSLTAAVHLGPVQRHVGSVDDGVDFHVQGPRNRIPMLHPTTMQVSPISTIWPVTFRRFCWPVG